MAEPRPALDVAALEAELDVAVLEAREVSTAAVERVIAPTPDLLDAALTGDPEVMREALSLHPCFEGVGACPSEFADCTPWSDWSICHVECPRDITCNCASAVDPGCGGFEGSFVLNSFQVCFNAEQQACSQRMWSIAHVCGC